MMGFGLKSIFHNIFQDKTYVAINIGGLAIGFAAFTAERRTKEIGVRKVLGASVGDIMILMLWDFSKPVLIVNLIAWPIAYYFMANWLNGFAYRISLDLWYFLGAGLLALLIAWLTASPATPSESPKPTRLRHSDTNNPAICNFSIMP